MVNSLKKKNNLRACCVTGPVHSEACSDTPASPGEPRRLRQTLAGGAKPSGTHRFDDGVEQWGGGAGPVGSETRTSFCPGRTISSGRNGVCKGPGAEDVA